MTRPILKEISDTYRFFFKTPCERKRIVFYSEQKGYYSYFEGVIEKITNKYDCTISYITSDYTDPILTESNQAIESFYCNVLLPYVMAIINVPVFVMTVPDFNRYNLRRSVYPVHYVYIFHAIVSTHMIYREGAFDHYDTLFCAGPHHVKEIRAREEQEQLPAKRLIEAGYYPLDRINKTYQLYVNTGKKKEMRTHAILIAPSWGADNILENCGNELISRLLGAGYKTILRPHRETIKRFPELIQSFLDTFGGNPNFILETTDGHDDSILKSDLLISDYSGIVFEYAFGTERPVLFIDVPPKMNNPNYKKIKLEPILLALRQHVGTVISPNNLDALVPCVRRLMQEGNTYRAVLQKLRSQYIYSFGESAEKEAQALIKIVEEKQKK